MPASIDLALSTTAVKLLIAYGEVGKQFAVEGDTCFAKTFNKPAVGNILSSGRPVLIRAIQRVLSTLYLACPVCTVKEPWLQRLLRDLVVGMASSQYPWQSSIFFAVIFSSGTVYCSWHSYSVLTGTPQPLGKVFLI